MAKGRETAQSNKVLWKEVRNFGQHGHKAAAAETGGAFNAQPAILNS